METDRWNVLLTALEKGSLCAAGEAMDYTVSGVSRSVAALEAELGFPLLYRSKSGVRPTPACERLLPAVRELLFAEKKIAQQAAQIRGCEDGVVGIGTAYRRYYRWITRVTSHFHELHPGVQFKIVNGTSTDLIQQLEHHQLDLCIISAREGDHRWVPLRRDPLFAVVPAGHPLANGKAVSLEAFRTVPYIETCPGLDIDSSRMFARNGIRPNTCFSTIDIQATYAMVGAGLGLSVSNRINSNRNDPDVRHLPLDPPQDVELGLACGRELLPAAEVFWQYLQTQLPRDVE